MRTEHTLPLLACLLAGCVAVPPAPGPAASSGGATVGAAGEAGPARRVRFNGVELEPAGWTTLAQLEAATRRRLPDGDYWYDPACGASGVWGGPTLAVVPAGLPLGGPLPAEASGGGTGRLTGVFINGRELHPADVQGLTAILGAAPVAGRYWVDAQGNAGREGGPAMVNLVWMARQRGAAARPDGRGWYHAGAAVGGNYYAGSDGQTSYFFDGASGCSVMDGQVSC